MRRKRIVQMQQATFKRDVTVNTTLFSDITGMVIKVDVKSMDLSTTYARLSSIGGSPEIVINTPAPTMEFTIRVDDIRTWDNNVLVASFLIETQAGDFIGSEVFEIDNRTGVTTRD